MCSSEGCGCAGWDRFLEHVHSMPLVVKIGAVTLALLDTDSNAQLVQVRLCTPNDCSDSDSEDLDNDPQHREPPTDADAATDARFVPEKSVRPMDVAMPAPPASIALDLSHVEWKQFKAEIEIHGVQVCSWQWW